MTRRHLPVFRGGWCPRLGGGGPWKYARGENRRALPVLGVRMSRAENLAHQFWLALENAHWRRRNAWWLEPLGKRPPGEPPRERWVTLGAFAIRTWESATPGGTLTSSPGPRSSE